MLIFFDLEILFVEIYPKGQSRKNLFLQGYLSHHSLEQKEIQIRLISQ